MMRSFKQNRLSGIVLYVCLVCLAVMGSSTATGRPTGADPVAYPVVDTGQSNCFGNTGVMDCSMVQQPFYGQDAQYSGNQPLYTDHGDGTVTDQHTGLMWEKGFKTMLWDDAQGEAAACRTGGYTDWRVPTIKELYSLIDFNGNQGTGTVNTPVVPDDAVPFINTQVFDFEWGTSGRYIDVQYISGTEYTSDAMGNPEIFFGVNFADGRIKGYPKSGNMSNPQFPVRFVRGNADYGINDLIDNQDGTVTDRSTALMWVKADSGSDAFRDQFDGFTNSDGSMNWEEALAFCDSLTYAGYSDWRLPNAKELHTILDYTRSPDFTGSAAIDPTFDTSPIIAENGERDWPFFWTSTTFNPGMDAIIICFGEALGYLDGEFMDVHGAGCQRTDAKTGSPSYGFGPQGEVRRVYNFVRPVRDSGNGKSGDHAAILPVQVLLLE